MGTAEEKPKPVSAESGDGETLDDIIRRIKDRHPEVALALQTDSVDSVEIPPDTGFDGLVKMFGEKRARQLLRGAETRDEILHRKLPDY